MKSHLSRCFSQLRINRNKARKWTVPQAEPVFDREVADPQEKGGADDFI
jgi:hypothetical protein